MSNITKKDLVERISDRTGLTQVDTKIVLESFLETVSEVLNEGKNIEIRGFGRFKIKEKRARTARNPRTNEYIQIEQGFKPVFEASKELRNRVNDQFVTNPQWFEENSADFGDLPHITPAPQREQQTEQPSEPKSTMFSAPAQQRRDFPSPPPTQLY